MAFFYLCMAFFVIGILVLLGITIFGIIMFFKILLKKKSQDILKILKMPEAFMFISLILFCLFIQIFIKHTIVENNINLLYFVIGIPTIFISKSLSRGLTKYSKDLYTWIFAILFGFASLALCALLHYILFNGIMKGESGFGTFARSLIISTIVGIISVIINLLEINKRNFKE